MRKHIVLLAGYILQSAVEMRLEAMDLDPAPIVVTAHDVKNAMREEAIRLNPDMMIPIQTSGYFDIDPVTLIDIKRPAKNKYENKRNKNLQLKHSRHNFRK